MSNPTYLYAVAYTQGGGNARRTAVKAHTFSEACTKARRFVILDVGVVLSVTPNEAGAPK